MRTWLYSVNGIDHGPVNEKKIVQMVLDEELDLESYIMSDDKPVWVKIKTVQSILDKIHEPEIVLNYDTKGLAEFVNMDQPADDSALFFYIPVQRLIIMSLLTGGIYQLYWFYKQWKYIRSKSKYGFRSFDRVGTYIFFPWYILGEIASNRELNVVERSSFSPFWLATGWAFGDSLVGISTRQSGGWLYSILMSLVVAYLNVLFLIPVQNYINSVNQKLHKTYSPKSAGHYTLIILVALLIVFYLFMHGISWFQLFKVQSEVGTF